MASAAGGEDVGTAVSSDGRRWTWRDKGLTMLPTSVYEVDTIEEIDASMNDLKFVHLEDGKWPHLVRLVLNDNELSFLPSPVTNLTGLVHLELADNQLTLLDDEVALLTRLNTLDLHGNRLSSLPDGLSRLEQLTSLKVGFNQLGKAPTWLGALTNLERLDLQSNRLTSLPVEISQLTRLKELYLSKNKLLKLPTEYRSLRQLKVLQLEHNDLVDPPQFMTKLGPEPILAYLSAAADGSGASSYCRAATLCLFPLQFLALTTFWKRNRPFKRNWQRQSLRGVCCRPALLSLQVSLPAWLVARHRLWRLERRRQLLVVPRRKE